MKKNFRRIILLLIVFVICISLASLSFAAPPDHARSANKGEKMDKGTPPGLINKGGLPPGLHGRAVDELPPGIRNNPNFREAVERLKEEEKKQEVSFIIIGSEYIIIPDEGVKTETYNAVFKDEDGNEKAVEASWSVDNSNGEVNIDKESGVLTVTAFAEEDSIVTVKAHYTTYVEDEEVSYAAEIEVTLYKPAVSSIEIVGDKFVAVQEDAEEPLVLEYAAVVKDQNDQIMEDKEVTWYIDNHDIDFDDGIINIVNLPGPDEEITFTLTAKYLLEETTITSTELDVVVYHPVFERIEISGASEITLPTEGQKITVEYEAVALDQHGQAIEKALNWFLEEGVSGVTLEDGVLTVTDEAEEGAFWIWVYGEGLADDLYGFEVTIVEDDVEETD